MGIAFGGTYFFSKKVSSAQRGECVSFSFFTGHYSGEHHDDRFPNLPKFDYGSAKASNNAVASVCIHKPKSFSVFSPLVVSFFSSLQFEVRNKE